MAVRDAANYNSRLADIRRNFKSNSVDLQTNVGGGVRGQGCGEGSEGKDVGGVRGQERWEGSEG